MNQVEFERLQKRERELEAEVARLQSQLQSQGSIPIDRGSTPPVGPDEIFLAIEKTRMPMILTDPNQPDDPIIFVNRAFQELSGYPAEELLGRNCRFLQGPATDPAQVAEIRRALAERRDIAIEILNHRRDGTPFVNELYISPVFDRDGRLIYHFGSQYDITGYRKDRRRLEDGARWQRAIIDSSIEFAIVATDLDGRVTDWNTGAERIFGWTAEEMRGQTAERFFTPEDRASDRIETEMRLAVETGRAGDERWHLRKDGSRFWASGEMMPLADERGPLGFLKILRDRTAEHLAGERLAVSEERYRTLFETVETGFCIIELRFDDANQAVDYRIVEANPAFERLTGQHGVIGRWVSDFAPTLERHWFDTYGRVALTGEPVRFENAAEAFGCWYDVQALRIGDPAAHRVAILFNDISARRSVELSLAKSEEHWRGLFERLHEGMLVGELVRDADGRATDWRYLDVNPAWGRLVGIDHLGSIGRTIREVFPGIEDEWVMEFVEVVESGQPKTFTRQVGSLGRWYEGRAFALDGDRFAVLFLEVTERVHAEVRRNALLDIGDSLRDFASPEEMTLQVFAIIGQALGATRVGLGRLDRDSDTVTIGPDWRAPGVASLAGQHRLTDYGEIREDILWGQPLVIHDVQTDSRASQNLERWQAIRVRSMVNMPVREHGRTVGLLFVHHDAPHHWDRETLSFLRNVADRLFTSLARLQAEADQRLVNQELSHRMKNMLAMVQAIASQTLKGVTERDAVQSFRSRLMALSHAHDALLQTTWSAADLNSVAKTVLEGTGQMARIRVSGPAVTLGPRATLSLSLLLHELTTNAMKYGALSVETGFVTVDWRIEAASNELVFNWQEHGGPPAREPTRRGFGSQLIRSGLIGTGETELRYTTEGFRAGMRADLDQIREA